MRPGIANCLKSVVEIKDFDYTPFEETMKMIAEEWFGSLFATSLVHLELLRV